MLSQELRNSYNKVNGDGNVVAGVDNSINGDGNAVKGIMNGVNGESNLVYGLGNKVDGGENVVYGEGNVVKGLDNESMTNILDKYKVLGDGGVQVKGGNLRTSGSYSEGNAENMKKMRSGSVNGSKGKISG